jgi:hypothetical protein
MVWHKDGLTGLMDILLKYSGTIPMMSAALEAILFIPYLLTA